VGESSLYSPLKFFLSNPVAVLNNPRLTVVRMILMIVASVVEVELMMMPVIVLGMCWMNAVSAVVITLLAI